MKKISLLSTLFMILTIPIVMAQSSLSPTSKQIGSIVTNSAAGTATTNNGYVSNLVPQVITYSASQNIAPGLEIACASATSFRDNSIYVDFNLNADFGVVNDFDVASVEFAIGEISTPSSFPITVQVWSSVGDFPGGTLTLQGTGVHTATNADLETIVSVPVAATIPAGEKMVIELMIVDDLSDTNMLRFGANDDGFGNGESWIKAEDCGVASPTPWGDLGLTQDIVLNVVGEKSGFVYESGSWIPSDPNTNATATDNITVLSGTTSLSQALEVNNITVKNGATLNVEDVLTINGDIINNGNLVFKSSATKNGELAAVPANVTISGDITVERYMQNKRSYRMVSSAVTTTTTIHDNWQEGATSNTDNPNLGFGTHITGTRTDQTDGFDATGTGNASMFTVNIASQQFEAIDNTNINTLTAGEGYLLFVRGDRSINLYDDSATGETILRATGSLATGTQTQLFNSSQTGNFFMFGNPYQSAVNMVSVYNSSSNVSSSHYYIYDPSLGSNGSYVTVFLPYGINTSGSVANQYLQPGQAAQALTVNSGITSIVFNESDKAPGNRTSTNASSVISNMLTVQLYTNENFTNGGPVHDSFGIIFNKNNTNDITPADAVKPMNFYENLGINNNETFLSIEQREMPQADEVYTIYSTGYQYSDYTLKVIVDGLEENYFYLEDSFTGTSTLLETGENSYNFTIDANDSMSIATDRFTIRTEQRLKVDDNSLLTDIRLFPNPLNGNTFNINAPKLNGEQLLANISDLTGRSIYNQTLDCNDNTISIPMDNNVAAGVYLVTLKNGGDSQTYRLIKK